MNISSSGVESFLDYVDDMQKQWSNPRDGWAAAEFWVDPFLLCSIFS